MRPARGVALAAGGVLAASILLLPWYGLGAYEPNGWDASFWLRAALVLTAANLVAVRAGSHGAGSPALAGAAAALVAVRVLLPPDFGFDFDGLDVPVERRVGAWVGLGGAGAMLASALVARRRGESAGVRTVTAARTGGW